VHGPDARNQGEVPTAPATSRPTLDTLRTTEPLIVVEIGFLNICFPFVTSPFYASLGQVGSILRAVTIP